MAFTSGANATISVNGVDLSLFTTSAKFNRKGKDEKHHLLNNGGVVTLIHDPEVTMDLEGLFDPIVHTTLVPLNSASAPAVPCIYQPQGALGGIVETFNAFVVDFNEDTDGEKGAVWKATLGVTGPITG